MRVRGFSLTELMVVVSIIGILSALTLPQLSHVARTFQGKEVAQGVLAAVRSGRSLAEKRNEPALVRAVEDSIILFTPRYSGDTDGYLVPVDTNDWNEHRRISLPEVKFHEFPTEGIAFCPSGEARFRKGTVEGAPICGLGDLASAQTTLVFDAVDTRYKIELGAALGSAQMRLAE